LQSRPQCRDARVDLLWVEWIAKHFGIN
jgi:hypothetical protein